MTEKWRLIVAFLKEHKWRVGGTLGLGIISSILTVVIPISIGKFYGLLFSYQSHRAKLLDFLPAWFFDTFTSFFIFFATAVLLRFVINYFERFQTAMLGEHFVKKLRDDLFAHQLKMQMNIYDEKGIGRYLLRYSGDMKTIQNYLTGGIIRFIRDVFLLIVVFVAILTMSVQLGLVLLVAMPLMALLIYFINKLIYRVSATRRDTRSGMLSFVNSSLLSILTIKFFNKEYTENKKFQKRSETLLERGKSYHKISSLFYALVPTLLYLLLGVVLLSAMMIKSNSGEISEGVLLAAVLLLITILPVFRRVLGVSLIWKLGEISFEKLFAVMNLPDEDQQEKPDLQFKKGNITLENVSFGYAEGNNFLINNLNLKLRNGKVTWLKGSMGSGKTSLIKLLMGLYEPSAGHIIFDGQDISETNIKSLRRRIAVVSDDLPPLGKTVFEAISYSRKQEKKKGAKEMLNQVQKSAARPNRLHIDDSIGALGSNLSRGQQKILNYTRALLTGKPVLIFEEPFAGLDDENCKYLGNLINEMKAEKTIIILNQNDFSAYLKPDVTHDLDNIQNTPTMKIVKD